eukprot:2849008-Lingulodinium_polyedra.AAC.1
MGGHPRVSTTTETQPSPAARLASWARAGQGGKGDKPGHAQGPARVRVAWGNGFPSRRARPR